MPAVTSRGTRGTLSDAIIRLTAALEDRYRIERELGAGGMATVYLAHDVRHDRKVALKVLRPELSAILGGERFLAEIKTTANLQHPHILGLFDSGIVGSGDRGTEFLYYVMPYVEGESLRERLSREKQLPVDEAVRIAREVADALQYAHEHGIVHRDIKPENILLHGGHALVADFGIALAASRSEGGTRMTETGMSLGTPHYMAPEQAMGEREITAKADIYALGCVLYEMLTAEPPFVGATAQAIIARVMTEEPRSLTLQRHTIPPNVEAAVRTALEKLPADRFATAAAFAEALGRADFTLSQTRATGAPVHRSAGVSARLRATAPWGIAAVAVIALAAQSLRRAGGDTAAGPVRFYHVPDSGHSITGICCGPSLAISPDGRRIAYEGQALRIQIWVRELDQLAARPLQGTEGARNLFFSPDGQWIGYTVGNNRLMKVPVTGGAPVTVADVGGLVIGATWTRDHRIVFARLDSAGLWAVTAEGGRVSRLVTPDSTDNQVSYAWPHYVPESDAVLFAVNSRTISVGGARVGMLRLGKGDVRIVSPGAMPQFAAGHLVTVRDGGALVAQRFDPARGDTSGPLARLADGIITRAGAMAEVAVSASGTLTYPLGSGAGVMLLITPNEGESRLPVHVPQVSHFDSPRFSPDGRRLLFAGFNDQENRHVGYILDLERGNVLRLSFGGNTEFLEWSPDGARVFYRKGDSLAVRRSDRSGEETILLRPAEGRHPNGRVSVTRDWLAFAVAGEGGSDIWAMRIAGGADSARPYLVTPFSETSPTLSPDGRWIAFSANETGRSEVYVAAFPEAGARASVSVEGGSEPVWSRDGRVLYYRDELGDLIAARLRVAASGVTVESRRTLVRGGSHERSPDGAEYDVHSRGERVVAFGTSRGGGRLVVTVGALRTP
jgi:hypothetical protein